MKIKNISFVLLFILIVALSISCTSSSRLIPLDESTKGATQYTVDSNNHFYTLLDFNDNSEYENASRGLIAKPEKLEIVDSNNRVVWSQEAYSFLDNPAPDTANPSLWRNTELNHIYGLFEVVDGIYQVRGYDMANMTFIKGDTGWIIIDPLMSNECAKAALELVKENLGDYPIRAIIYSHPHVDHFGGVKGIISDEDAKIIPIIVPEGFEEHAISENVYAGNAMARRAGYQYGTLLTPGETGNLSIGIGMGQSRGTTSYISPNYEICTTGERLTLDGIEIEFQLTPGTEAPCKMNFWIESKKALWMAENCTGTLHNLYTLRGAQVRDGNAWAKYIMQALALYGDKAEVVFQSHNWPHWTNSVIKEYLLNTAAIYKYINDQSLLYINQGYTESEIANSLELPEKLEKVWYTRQYYGTVAHNAKAVYQKYMGWYDGNPVHLAELTPSAYAAKLLSYLGDESKILKLAREDFEKGEYQWVAQITNILVYANPSNTDARYLCADALEQLAYKAEAGPWRNAYLCASQELRFGTNTDPSTRPNLSGDAVRNMTPEMIFDYLGILVDSKKAEDLSFVANVILPNSCYTLHVVNGVVLYQEGVISPDADVTWESNKLGLLSIVQRNKDGVKAYIKQTGESKYLEMLLDAVTSFTPYNFFNIIEP